MGARAALHALVQGHLAADDGGGGAAAARLLPDGRRVRRSPRAGGRAAARRPAGDPRAVRRPGGAAEARGVGSEVRAARPFRLLVERPDATERVEFADVVLDCTGTYSNPNPTGADGIAAPGERAAGSRILLVLGRRRPDVPGLAAARPGGNAVVARSLRRRTPYAVHDLGPMRAGRRDALLALTCAADGPGIRWRWCWPRPPPAAGARGGRVLPTAHRTLEGHRNGVRHAAGRAGQAARAERVGRGATAAHRVEHRGAAS